LFLSVSKLKGINSSSLFSRNMFKKKNLPRT
jgi:hypothetical protein